MAHHITVEYSKAEEVLKTVIDLGDTVPETAPRLFNITVIYSNTSTRRRSLSWVIVSLCEGFRREVPW